MKCFSGLALLLTAFTVSRPTVAADTLDIYWIDVEGGASTLVVTPSGESVLMDSGWPGFEDRDAKRIEKVVKKADLAKIDYVITSHFHRDHVGGIVALAKRVEIGQFLDHGDSVEKDSEGGRELWQAYLATAEGKRRIVKPGDELPLQGVELTIVAAHSHFLAHPLADAGTNSLCDSFEPHPVDETENGKSTGYLLQMGSFQFVNLGDLSWNFQHQMACPVNLLGKVDLFQVTHHGGGDDVLPQQMWALEPTVAVMNNGPTKGAGLEAVETVMASPGLEDLWQLHRADGLDDAHNTDERRIANLTEGDVDEGYWLEVNVHPDGSYTLTNSRNSFSKTYRSK